MGLTFVEKISTKAHRVTIADSGGIFFSLGEPNDDTLRIHTLP